MTDGSPSQEKEPEPYPKPRPKDEPPALSKLRELIETTLAGMFERYLTDERGNYILGLDSARVFVVPTWLEEGPSVVRVFAITNLDVPVTADLTGYLLARNLEFVLGAFALDADAGAVWFNHNLLGEHAHEKEIEASIAAVAQTADRYDDEIKQRFGGRLYVESPDEAAPQPPMPGYL